MPELPEVETVRREGLGQRGPIVVRGPRRRAPGLADPALVLTGREAFGRLVGEVLEEVGEARDRKSTRLNSSHVKRSRMPSSA